MYKELFSDPIDMVKKIYQHVDLEYSDEFEEYMKHYGYGVPEKMECNASFDFGLK